MKKLSVFLLLVVLLGGCATNRSDWPGYAGTMESYTYFHQDERNMAWEEDVLNLAEQFLTNHPLLCDDDFRIENLSDWNDYDPYDVVYSNEYYDPVARESFIGQINQLIPEISGMSDIQILYELQRIIASLNDAHSTIEFPQGEFLPVLLEPITEGDSVSLHAVRVPAEHSQALWGRLCAINGVTVEEIMERLIPYISHENQYWCIHKMTYIYSDMLLTQKDALVVIGVMGPSDTDAELTFETETCAITCRMDVVTKETFKQLDVIDSSMPGIQAPSFQYKKYYWYEQMGENVLYVRFRAMEWDTEVPLNTFLAMVSSQLQNAETPMRLVIDFRSNTGGYIFYDELRSFVSAVNRCENDGVYLLINGNSFSAAVWTPYYLSCVIEGAQLIGSPAAQFVNIFSLDTTEARYMPNSGYAFRVSSKYMNTAPGADAVALLPDIPVYQTLEDYQNGVDTVLEYVLAIN